MNVSALSGSDFQRVMNEAIAKTATTEVGKTAEAVVDGNSLTITYTDPAGNQVAMEPIELEEAEDGGILADPQAIKELMDKIEKSFSAKDIQLDQKLVDDFTKCLRQEIDKVKSNETDSYSSFHDTYSCIFAIIRVVQQANKALKDAAMAKRQSALALEVAAIYDRAEAEKYAAVTGLIVAGAVGGLQLLVSGGMKVKELSADFKADKVLSNKGVLANEKIMENTMLLEMPKAAEVDVAKCAKGMNVATMQKIAAEVGGYEIGPEGKPVPVDASKLPAGCDTGVIEAKAQLAKTITERNAVQSKPVEKIADDKFKFDGVEYKTKEEAEAAKNDAINKLDEKIDTDKASLVRAVDDKVKAVKIERDTAETKLNVAKAELDAAKDKAGVKGRIPGTKEWKEIKRLEDNVAKCQTKLDTLNKDLVFANAIRTNLFAHKFMGESLLSHQECRMRQGAAKSAFNESQEMAMNSNEFKQAQHSAKTWSALDKCSDLICNMLNSVSQQVPAILRTKAEKMDAVRVEWEGEYSNQNDIVQTLTQAQNKVNELYIKIFESWLSNMRQAIV